MSDTEPVDDGSSEVESALAMAAFHQTRAELLQERQAAYATRETDRERWRAAKQAYADWRTSLKELDVDNRYANSSPVAEPAEGAGVVHEGGA